MTKTITIPSESGDRRVAVGQVEYDDGTVMFDIDTPTLSRYQAICSNVGREQAEAIIAALREAFPETSKPVRPEPFSSQGMAGTKLTVSRDWNETFDRPLPYVTVSLDRDSIARPVLASIPLSEARRLSEWLDENGFEAE